MKLRPFSRTRPLPGLARKFAANIVIPDVHLPSGIALVYLDFRVRASLSAHTEPLTAFRVI